MQTVSLEKDTQLQVRMAQQIPQGDIAVKVFYATDDEAYVSLMDHPTFGDRLWAKGDSPAQSLREMARVLTEEENKTLFGA